MKGFMDFKQLHEVMIAFETKCKDLKREAMPLEHKVIEETLRPIGLSVTETVFKMWCKKCW